MADRVTMKDVAKEAGVSFKTVSNVINNTGRFRESTRINVMQAIEKLGYVGNSSARSLKTGVTRLIGLSIFDFSQPFASYLADQVIYYARQRGYGVIVNTYGTGHDCVRITLEKAAVVPADGWLIFMNQPLEDHGESLEHQPYPIVLAGDCLAYGKVDLVTMPNTESMRDVTGQLLDAGYRKIAVFGAVKGRNDDLDFYLNATQGTQELRVRGYLEAYLERGLQPDPSMLFSWGSLMIDSGIHAVEHMLEIGTHPEIIVCLNDAMAFGAMHGLETHGIHIPEDIQVIGFDNVPESAISNPSLTTIDPHMSDYARHGVDMLIERIQGYDGPVRTYETQYSIVERASLHI